MPDPRFYEALGPISLARLAQLAGAELDSRYATVEVDTVAPLNRADRRAVSFAVRGYEADLAATGARACFVSAALADKVPEGCVPLVCARPQVAYAIAAAALHAPRTHDSRELVHPTAELENGVVLSPGAVVGPGAQIGRGTVLGAYAVVGAGVAIGRNCVLGPHASVAFALVGDRVRILAGARVGEAGFGVTAAPDGAMDIPQLGRAIIQDGVTIGAGSCVDRGAWDDTVVGENSKLDNLVHVGHNSRVGRNCLMAAYVGISGSVAMGDGVTLGGRAGVADHVTIGEGANIAAAAAVMKDVPARETWAGQPARPLKRWLRETAWVANQARRKTGKGAGE